MWTVSICAALTFAALVTFDSIIPAVIMLIVTVIALLYRGLRKNLES